MHGDRGIFIFFVQLTTSRIGNLTRLIHTLLYVMTIHTYIQRVTRSTGFGMHPPSSSLLNYSIIGETFTKTHVFHLSVFQSLRLHTTLQYKDDQSVAI